MSSGALPLAKTKKKLCCRCRRRPGHSTWSVCADGNKERVICWLCDKALNRLVLRWMRDQDWRAKCERYERSHDRSGG